MLVAVFQPSWSAGSEESVGSLEDVISTQDQAHLEQVLGTFEPYNTMEEAYHVARGVFVLGVTDSNRKVTWDSNEGPSAEFQCWCALFGFQLVESACRYAIANAPKTLEDIFYASSIGALYSKTCEVSIGL